jgi:hypothetical protein
MKRISVQVPDCMYKQLRDLASKHCMPMSLYARMLMVQAWKIGPEMEEIKKRVDELHLCMNGFADALLEEEPEELAEAVQGQPAKTSKYL